MWTQRERMTVRKTDKAEERESVRCRHSPPSSPGNFLSPHAITLSPRVRATLSPIPLATEPVSPLSCDQVHL
ncbi:hypothetical protein PBY51_018661 [Eleginops maclovinus]|uniref:Uncharacterized protein n=1 Tax=Eleginops maclovinus TaxID=56733 RepID=A0AAN7Y8P4_ELEMC|nr:hypothetical protein PBY51_018661 [Eleginops maclovinus]